MKLLITSLVLISSLTLSACGRKDPSPLDSARMKLQQQNYAEQQAVQKSKLSSEIPKTEIIYKVNGSDVYVHKFIDPITNKTCYFNDYNYNMSCS